MESSKWSLWCWLKSSHHMSCMPELLMSELFLHKYMVTWQGSPFVCKYCNFTMLAATAPLPGHEVVVAWWWHFTILPAQNLRRRKSFLMTFSRMEKPLHHASLATYRALLVYLKPKLPLSCLPACLPAWDKSDNTLLKSQKILWPAKDVQSSIIVFQK